MSSTACHNMDSLPVTNKAAGEPESLMNKALETGAAAVQVTSFKTVVVLTTKPGRTSSLCSGSAPISMPSTHTHMTPSVMLSRPTTTAHISMTT